MRILNRYLFNNLLQPLVYLIVAFTLLFIIGDLMDNANNFLEAGTSPLEMAYYYTLRLPSMVIMIVPLCLLLAVLYSLSTLTRHSEIIAMRSCGIAAQTLMLTAQSMGYDSCPMDGFDYEAVAELINLPDNTAFSRQCVHELNAIAQALGERLEKHRIDRLTG